MVYSMRSAVWAVCGLVVCVCGASELMAQQARPRAGINANGTPSAAAAATNPAAAIYLIPQVQMNAPPIAQARRQQLAQSKQRATLVALRQKASRTADGRVMWRLPNNALRPLVSERSVSLAQNKTPAQIPQALTRHNAYVNGGGGGPPASYSLKGRQSAVQDQKDRGTCVAFAVLGALEAAYGGQVNLSEQDAWYLTSTSYGGHPCMDGSQATHILETVAQHGIALETDWPYQTSAQMGCPADINDVARRPRISRPSAAQQNARWGPLPGQLLVRKRQDNLTSDSGEFANNPRLIEAWISAGYEVIIGVGVAADLGSSSLIDVTLGEDGQPLGSWAGHEMVIVGYNRAGGGVFEVKNSWGTGAGTNGYSRLSYDYIRTYATEASVILTVRQANPTRSNAEIAGATSSADRPEARGPDATRPQGNLATPASNINATVIPQRSLSPAQRTAANNAKAALLQSPYTRTMAAFVDDQCRLVKTLRQGNPSMSYKRYTPLWSVSIASNTNTYLQCPGTERCVIPVPEQSSAPTIAPSDWEQLSFTLSNTPATAATQRVEAIRLWQALLNACR